MSPRGMPSLRVKLRPWYYADRRQVTRAAELAAELAYEQIAEE